MRTQRVAALAVASMALALSACGSGSGSSTATGAPQAASWRNHIKAGSLEVGVLPAVGTKGYKFLESQAAGIDKQYPGSKIKLTFANTQARPALEQRWRSGSPLDVDYTMFDGTNASLRDWAESGKLLNLKPYLEANDPATGKPWLDRYSPAVRSFMTDPKDGGIYGVPTELSLQVLFYNAAMFDKLGIAPPKTWDDLLAASDKIKASGVSPIAVTGLFEPYMGMWTDNLWMRTVGYDKAHAVLSEGKGRITDDPGFLKGLQMAQDLRDRGALLKGFQGTDFTAAQAQFFQGKAGMILMGTWLVSEMADVIPPGFKLGVVAFPTVPGAAGDQSATIGTVQQVSVAASSKSTALALDWIDNLTSVKTQTERADQIGDTSAVMGVPSPPGMPGIDSVIKSATQIKSAYYGLLSSKAKDVVYPQIAKLMFGKQDAQQTLTAIDQGLRRVYGN